MRVHKGGIEAVLRLYQGCLKGGRTRTILYLLFRTALSQRRASNTEKKKQKKGRREK
jgi:hypothetical protein